MTVQSVFDRRLRAARGKTMCRQTGIYADGIERNNMKAVITVTGKDSVGIIAKVANKCSEAQVNIMDISQSVLQEYFAMIMLVDITGISCPFSDFVDTMSALGRECGLSITAMHEDIFNAMHHI